MILHLYFARRFLYIFLMLTGVFFMLVAMIEFVDQARRFSESDAVSFGQLVGLTLLTTPETINLILPLITMLATIALFIGLARTSELVVTRAAGRSAIRALFAPVAVALIAGGLAVTMLSPVIASATKRHTELSERYKTGRASSFSISGEGLWLRQGGEEGQSVIRAWRSNADASVLYDVTVLSYAPGGGPEQRIEAESASLHDGAWHLMNAKTWPLQIGVNAEANSVEQETLEIPSSLTVERIRESFGNPGTVSIWEMPSYIEQLEESGFSARRHRVWFQSELARPLFLVSMVLIASAFTMRHTRFGGTGIAVLSSLLLGFSLYFIRSFAQVLGENGQIPIILAAWAPPLAGTLLAMGFLLHREDG